MGTATYLLPDILKGSEYALTIFEAAELSNLKIFDKKGKPYITCAAPDRERPAKPEEIVRQLYINRLIKTYGYAKERIAVEKPVYFGSAVKPRISLFGRKILPTRHT
jgi:type I restriction enzyme M protein